MPEQGKKAMKKTLAIIMGVIFLFGAHCAHLRKKPSTGVEHQSATARFIGYKVTVRVKATPRQVEEYLLKPENLTAKAGIYELEMASKNQTMRMGEACHFKFKVAKMSFPCNFTLVYLKPGEELWFLGQADIGVMGLIRFHYKAMEGGTRIVVNYENEDPDTVVGGLAEAVNLPEAIVRLIEVEVAKGQEHFDPSVPVSELLKKGLRGEFYDAFFQSHQASVWLNAPPHKVQEYLYDPQSWVLLREKYEMFDFGPCFINGDPGPCPVRVKIRGMTFDFDSFPAPSKYGENLSAYWVNRMGIVRVNFTLKPEQGGTRFSFADMLELPSGITEEGGNLMMTIMQVPATVEKVLLGVKNEIEGTG